MEDIKTLIGGPTVKLKLYSVKVVKPCYDFELCSKFTVETSLGRREVYLHTTPS